MCRITFSYDDKDDLNKFIDLHIMNVRSPSPVPLTLNELTRWISHKNLKSEFSKTIHKDILKHKSFFFLDAKNNLRGILVLEYLQWDSEHFKQKIGRIKYFIFNNGLSIHEKVRFLNKVIEYTKSENYSMIYANVSLQNFDTIHALLECKGMLAGLDMGLCRKTDLKNFEYDPSINIREGSTSDIDDIKLLMTNSFTHSHFYNDPFLSKEKCDKLYQLWGKNSFYGFSDGVLVAEKGSKVEGFYTVKKKQIGKIEVLLHLDLLSTSGRIPGLGTMLTHHYVKYCHDHGYNLATVVTEPNNIVAMSLYEKAGFRTTSCEARFHIWVNK